MGRMYWYEFTKKVFPKYIVFIVVNGKLVTYSNDLDILNYIGYKSKLSKLDKYKINYLVLDDLDIIEIRDYGIENNYMKYLYLFNLDRVIRKIGNRLVDTNLL